MQYQLHNTTKVANHIITDSGYIKNGLIYPLLEINISEINETFKGNTILLFGQLRNINYIDYKLLPDHKIETLTVADSFIDDGKLKRKQYTVEELKEVYSDDVKTIDVSSLSIYHTDLQKKESLIKNFLSDTAPQWSEYTYKRDGIIKSGESLTDLEGNEVEFICSVETDLHIGAFYFFYFPKDNKIRQIHRIVSTKEIAGYRSLAELLLTGKDKQEILTYIDLFHDYEKKFEKWPVLDQVQEKCGKLIDDDYIDLPFLSAFSWTSSISNFWEIINASCKRCCEIDYSYENWDIMSNDDTKISSNTYIIFEIEKQLKELGLSIGLADLPPDSYNGRVSTIAIVHKKENTEQIKELISQIGHEYYSPSKDKFVLHSTREDDKLASKKQEKEQEKIALDTFFPYESTHYSNSELCESLEEYTFFRDDDYEEANWRDNNGTNQFKASAIYFGDLYPNEKKVNGYEEDIEWSDDLDDLLKNIVKRYTEKGTKNFAGVMALKVRHQIEVFIITDFLKLENQRPFKERYKDLAIQFIEICSEENEQENTKEWRDKVRDFQNDHTHIFDEYKNLSMGGFASLISDMGIPYEQVFTDLVRISNYD